LDPAGFEFLESSSSFSSCFHNSSLSFSFFFSLEMKENTSVN